VKSHHITVHLSFQSGLITLEWNIAECLTYV